MIDLTDHRAIHFVGIGGIGMSALARHLHARGYEVTGSDRAGSEQTEALAALGVEVHIGHAAAHVGRVDLVVVSSAVPSDNPELLEAKRRTIPVIKRSVLLAAITNPATGIAVAGTHGKSTTSALITHILLSAGRDVTALIGGVSQNLGSNARSGDGDLVVVEADEYDASFLQLRPTIGVITNVEADHLDFYGTIDRLHDAFRAFAESVTGTLVVCADDLVLKSLLADTRVRLITYGVDAGEWRARDIVERDRRTEFVVERGGETQRVRMSLAGVHNVRNALAALAVAVALGVSVPEAGRALETFAGVQRRFEIKGVAGDVMVMDDYAHHPTEIRVNLAAIRARFGKPIRVIFQPHTYSRTSTLLADFAGAFDDADVVYVTDIYAAREENLWGISAADLAETVREHAAKAGGARLRVIYSGSLPATLERVLADTEPGDLIATMGAGDVYHLGPQLLAALDEAPRATAPCGAGHE